ncbi:unnamed protein product [Paramecium primaurelia]|uniref:Uncharacterized protein n=1 Tax=Paramecium primaurelia TaxID=5886 RepID=A0A8S1NRJ5_PARPR|nr:unnamed protein product [Paramecium primaurelia]
MGDNNFNNTEEDMSSEESVMQTILNKFNSLLNNKLQIYKWFHKGINQQCNLILIYLDNEFKEMTDNTLMGLKWHQYFIYHPNLIYVHQKCQLSSFPSQLCLFQLLYYPIHQD